MTGLALLLAAAVIAAPAPKAKHKPDPCADPLAGLPALAARALEDGEDKITAPPQTKVLGRQETLKRLVFDGEPTHIFDVVVRIEADGEPAPRSLLLTRMERAPDALHREVYAASLKGELEGGAVFSDKLDENGETTDAPTLHHPLRRRDPAARAAFKEALKGLCREALGPSSQERILGLPDSAPVR